jgi:hypothetical protein
MPDRPATNERSSDKAKKPWHEPVLRDLGGVADVTASNPQGVGALDGSQTYHSQ